MALHSDEKCNKESLPQGIDEDVDRESTSETREAPTASQEQMRSKDSGSSSTGFNQREKQSSPNSRAWADMNSRISSGVGIWGDVHLAFSMPALVENCRKCYEPISRIIQNFETVDEQLEDPQKLFQLHAEYLEASLNLLSNTAELLNEETRMLWTGILTQLQSMLQGFLARFAPTPEVDAKAKVSNRVVLTIKQKSELERFLADFEFWNSRFFKRMCLLGIMLVAKAREQPSSGKIMPSGLELCPVLLPQRDLTTMLEGSGGLTSVIHIEASPASRGMTPSNTPMIVEYRFFGGGENETEKFYRKQSCRSSIRAVASLLHYNDRVPPSGILRCEGYFEDASRESFGLLSRIPDQARETPRSLKQIFADSVASSGNRHDLNDRVILANDIAAALLYVHSGNFVHKNIRPSNILLFSSKGDKEPEEVPKKLGRPYLIGFDQTRLTDDDTKRIGDNDKVHNMYRHPDRRGLKPAADHNMLHDIYSLGVVLLEIAMWRPLMVYRNGEMRHNEAFWGKLYNRICNATPRETQELYGRITESQVPRIIGRRYANVVLQCLQCVEVTFAQVNVKNDVDLGAAYIKKILEELEKISL